MKKPKISALVSTYNSAKYLPGCLDNLLSQTVVHDLEIIVINSGSQQDERAIVSRYMNIYANILYIETERETLYSAWNRGLQISSGEYICNANTDDRRHPFALELMADRLDRGSEIDLVYADTLITDTISNEFSECNANGCFMWPNYNMRDLFRVCYIGPHPMWRRSLHDHYGLFDESFKCAGDYEFWLRICGESNFLHIGQILGSYLERSDSIEHSSYRQNLYESALARKRYANKLFSRLPKAKGTYLKRFSSIKYGQNNCKLIQPKVSIVLPTKDRPKLLATSLESILNQTFKDLEVIIVNDGGIDISGLLSNYIKSPIAIHYVRLEENGGVAAARNIGIRMSSGKYIAYLDDDDTYYPNHVETLYTTAKQENSFFIVGQAYGISCLNCSEIDIMSLANKKVQYSGKWSFDDLLCANQIPTLCVLHHRSCCEVVGYFDEQLLTHEDWDLWVRLASKYTPNQILQITAQYRLQSLAGSLTVNQRLDFLRTMKIIHRRYIRLAQMRFKVFIRQKIAVARLQSELFLHYRLFYRIVSVIIPKFLRAKIFEM